MLRAPLLLAVATAMAATPASAQTYAATAVDIRDTAAIVQIIPETRTDIAVEVRAAGRLPAPEVALNGGRVVIDGGLDHRIRGCVGREGVRVSGVGVVTGDDLPQITIRTPRRVDLGAGGAVFARIGASDSARLQLSGCGGAQVGDVTGSVELALSGSGGAALGAAGSLQARVAGSGGLSTGYVGASEVALSGSGGIELGRVTGPLSAAVSGSGSLRVRGLAGGDAALRVSGSGGVDITAGQAERLDARVSGSGGIRFSGRADVVSAAVSGSGGVHVAQADHVESMRDSGSGGIHVGRPAGR